MKGTITIHCVNFYGVRVESEKAGIVVEVHYEPTEGADFEKLNSKHVTCSHNLDQLIAEFTPTLACSTPLPLLTLIALCRKRCCSLMGNRTQDRRASRREGHLLQGYSGPASARRE